MSELLIKRIYQDDHVTLGTLFIKDAPQLVTLELPYRENRHNISCIPLGAYNCERTKSPRFADTLRVLAVKDRTGIIFHSGNSTEDTEGCIILGMSFDCRTGNRLVVDSGFAMRRFRELLGTEQTFKLRIIAA